MSFVRIFGATALLLCLGLLATAPLKAEPAPRLVAFTGYLPPLSIDEHRKGIAVELMELVAEEAGLEIEIRYAPWKRAQVLAETTPGSLLFTAARSRDRRKKFNYIAPLLYTESAFVTLDQPLDTIEEALAKDKIIGVHLGSQRSRILKRHGIGNLEEISSAEQMSAMLRAGRIDAWYTMSLRARYIAREQGHDPNDLVIGAPISQGIQWLVGNRDIDPSIRSRLAAAVSRVWRDPRYWQIVDQHAHNVPVR